MEYLPSSKASSSSASQQQLITVNFICPIPVHREHIYTYAANQTMHIDKPCFIMFQYVAE